MPNQSIVYYMPINRNSKGHKSFFYLLCEPSKYQIPNEGPTNIAVDSKLIVTSRSDVCPLEQETIG